MGVIINLSFSAHMELILKLLHTVTYYIVLLLKAPQVDLLAPRKRLCVKKGG